MSGAAALPSHAYRDTSDVDGERVADDLVRHANARSSFSDDPIPVHRVSHSQPRTPHVSPGKLRDLRESLKNMTDAEAAVVVLAAARTAVVAERLDVLEATADDTKENLRPKLPPVSKALLLQEDEEFRDEIEERWAHSKRHRIVLKLSFAALVLTWAAMLVVIALLGYALATRISDINLYVLCIGAMFVGVSMPLTLYDIYMHLLHYVNPRLQRYYIRILWLVPIFSVASLAALGWNEHEPYIAAPRDVYESYVVYMFLSLIVDAIGSREKIAAILLERASVSNEPYIRLARPLCCFRWRAGRPFMFNVSVGVLQFVVLRVVLAFIEPLTEALHVYKDGVFGLRNAFGWCTIAMFFSQLWAIYCLVLLYIQVQPMLPALHPLGKFMTIKAIVFFNFWQGIAISAIRSLTNAIEDSPEYTAYELSKFVQNSLTCVESVGFAVLHHYYFSFHDFDAEISAVESVRHGLAKSLSDMMPLDFFVDVRDLFTTRKTSADFAAAAAIEYAREATPETSTAGVSYSQDVQVLRSSDAGLHTESSPLLSTSATKQRIETPMSSYAVPSRMHSGTSIRIDFETLCIAAGDLHATNRSGSEYPDSRPRRHSTNSRYVGHATSPSNYAPRQSFEGSAKSQKLTPPLRPPRAPATVGGVSKASSSKKRDSASAKQGWASIGMHLLSTPESASNKTELASATTANQPPTEPSNQQALAPVSWA